jgi:hypothetical protein
MTKTRLLHDTKPVSLPCHLTDPERLQLGEQMAHAVMGGTKAEGEKKAADADFKSQTEGHYAQADRLATILNQGYELREVLCEVYRDWTAGLVVVLRKDTGEEVSSRPMTPEEKQLGLDVLYGTDRPQ